MIYNDIIHWLNNNNLYEANNNSTTLVECILIISINGILIEHQSLIDYCNRVQQENNNDKRVKNNKEEDKEEEEDKEISYYYGLSKRQFKTIYNNINSINNNNNNNNIDNSTSVSDLNNNKNEIKEYINSNKTKFNHAIGIISENNKCILKQQQQQQQQHNNNITITATIATTMKSLIPFSGRDIDIIFFQVWRNLVIRNEILFHTRLYNIHYDKEIILFFNELSTYKYRSYMNILVIEGNKEDDAHDDKGNKMYTLEPNLIPYGVSKISTECTIIITENSIPDSVTSIEFVGTIKQTFSKGILPNSITSMTIGSRIFEQTLSKSWLPSLIKSLTICYPYQQDIQLNQLPKSLTDLNLAKSYSGKIIEGSISMDAVKSLIHTLNYTFDSNRNSIKLTNESISKSTTSLQFDESFNQRIKLDDIPYNVISIILPNRFNREIEWLPLSLKSLKFGRNYNTVINANVLPSNLTSINMGGYNEPLIPNLFPQSITSIKMDGFYGRLPVGYFYNYSNLRSLEIYSLSNKFIPENTLPPSLELLRLDRSNGNIYNINTLPSLSTFKIGYLDAEFGKLPSSITSLTLYSRVPIPVGSLPCNLKELYFEDRDFNQDLSIDDILPQSLQSIYIHRGNIDYINSLDTHFFKKYIKYIVSPRR